MDNQIKTSPFAYRSNQALKNRGSGTGASFKRITILWQKNLINETHIPVLSILHALTYATSHMVEECYALAKTAEVPITAGKLPVKKLLLDLSSFGLVEVYSTYDGNSYTGAKIYTLSKGAKDWIQQILPMNPYFQGLNCIEKRRVWTYADVLSLLAANQFLIRMKAKGKQQGHRYVENPIFDAYERANYMIYIPVRRNTVIPDTIKINDQLRDTDKNRSYIYILGCEDSEHALSLHQKIKQDQHLFYITDQMVFYSDNPLENLTKYCNPESNESVLAAIKL